MNIIKIFILLQEIAMSGVCMYVYTLHTSVWTCVHTYVHMYVHIYIHIILSMRAACLEYVCIYIHMYERMYIYIHTYNPQHEGNMPGVCMYIYCIHQCECIYISTYKHEGNMSGVWDNIGNYTFCKGFIACLLLIDYVVNLYDCIYLCMYIDFLFTHTCIYMYV